MIYLVRGSSSNRIGESFSFHFALNSFTMKLESYAKLEAWVVLELVS